MSSNQQPKYDQPTEEAQELKPCPYPQCGAAESYFFRMSAYDSTDELWAVRCNECGALGPTMHNQEAAAEVWNTRTFSESDKNLLREIWGDLERMMTRKQSAALAELIERMK